MKATFDLDDDLYRAIRVDAARADRSVREVVEEALRDWLARAEEAEDRASAADAIAEYGRDGGASAEAWFGSLAAETKAAYATPEVSPDESPETKPTKKTKGSKSRRK
jgi:plasmid stability protein